jgi:ABC-type branched-subunit amino acid transport system substrate-binding protein
MSARRALATALLCLLGCVLGLAGGSPARAQTNVMLATHVSLTGSGAFSGRAYVEAVQMALDEANRAAGDLRFTLQAFDDGSTEQGAREAAAKLAASAAPLVLGPTLSPMAIVACPLYGTAGVPVVEATVHADEVTKSATTFRTVISTGEIGEALGVYLARVLHGTRASVFSRDNGYGRPLAARFRAEADRLGIAATYSTFATPAQRDAGAAALLANGDPGVVVLGMTYEDAVPVLTALRRAGYRGLVLGTATMARGSFADLFATEPEEARQPGFFTDGAYATSPMILDSANAEILAFAERFAARFGRAPSWESVQAYDAATLAMTAVRRAIAAGARPDDTAAMRRATLAAITAMDSPEHALAALNGPIWFTPDRIRTQAVRMGRFHGGLFESAPVQLLPATAPDTTALASGAMVEIGAGRFFRLQRVVQVGTYLNAIPRLDIAKSSFGADFYLWLRYARDGAADSDPAEIVFPNMLSGRFDAAHPAERATLADGTEYRLWRIQGDFRTDLDLHRFPFDRQTLRLSFYNARASSDRIVYVLDRRTGPSPGSAAQTGASTGGSYGSAVAATTAGGAASVGTGAATETSISGRRLVSAAAFRDLSQWRPLGAHERRESLVTRSSLGDLRRAGLGVPRELSGFLVTVDLERSAASVLVKTLLPVLLMTIIMYTTLHLPVALTKEKVTVAVTATLSGAVFLAAINTQLGGVGYTLAIEYAFYLFFALGLLCVVYVMTFENLRVAGHGRAALRVERGTRALFVLSIALLFATALAFYRGWIG